MKLAATWHSNSPHAATGYGGQTALIVKRMVQDGHAVAIVSNYGHEGAISEWEGASVYPRGWDAYNNDMVGPTIAEHARHHPDHAPVIMSLYDVWVYNAPAFDKWPVACWVPIDHAPVPPAVAAFLRKPNVTPIAMSQFGRQMLQDAGIECEYIPHAIDTDVFKPTEQVQVGEQLLTGREVMKVDPDAFVVGMFAANKGFPSRKAFGENVFAFSLFARDHPDAVLYLHTNREGLGGIDLDALVKACGLKPHQYRFIHQWGYRFGLQPTIVAALMSACDVGLLASCGEGFGIPAIELQACGTRVILNGFSAQSELVGDGWKTECQPWWDAGQGAWSSTPLIGSIRERLEESYAARRGRSGLARRFVVDKYDVNKVFDQRWRPVLDRLAERAGRAQAVQALPSSWDNGVTSDPLVTIYIPTYRRPELADLLAALKPQLVPEVEVIVSDNDGSAAPLVRDLMDAPCRVAYSRREFNIGGDANILRGFAEGTGDWLWIIGDDDVPTADAISGLLRSLADLITGSRDRLILLSKSASKSAAGAIGSLASIAERDPGLPLAATLISANVVRREACDIAAGMAKSDTKYGHAYAMPSQRVEVLLDPLLERVGYAHAGQGIPESWDGQAVKEAWLRSVGIEPAPEHFTWNYMSAEAK